MTASVKRPLWDMLYIFLNTRGDVDLVLDFSQRFNDDKRSENSFCVSKYLKIHIFFFYSYKNLEKWGFFLELFKYFIF